MAQIKPYILLRYGVINQPIRVPIQPILVDAVKSFLSANMAAASGTLTVENITGFAINQILLIGEPGNQGSEIIKTHASTAPTGHTVTLAANTVFPHSASTVVYILKFDQVEIYNAPTIAGTKTAFASSPYSLVANSETTDANDVTYTSGYYFARFKNSITTTYSSYSDPAPYAGYTILSARSIIDNALGELNKKTSEVLTDEFAFQQLNNYQSEIISEQKRWSFMQSFDTNIGETATGVWRVACPTNLDDQFTNRSIWNFRIGTQSDMIFVDKEKWNDLVSQVAHTTLAVSIVAGAATVTLTDSSDFPDGGTIQIADNQYPYTANARTTGILTLTSVSTTTNTLGEDVFQGASFGNPTYWTIFNNYIYHWPVTAEDYTQRNYYLDYYKKQTAITADSDDVVIPDPTCASYYLQWKFLKRLNNGQETQESLQCKANYQERREKIKQKNSIGRTFRLKPVKNTINVNSSYGTDGKSDRLRGWEV
jgi:hypothetical protein